MTKKNMFLINDIDFLLKVYDLAREHGKKPGESIQEEFEELLKQNPEAVTLMGTTEEDIDMLSGNLREQGIKVTNLSEIDRAKSRENRKSGESGENGEFGESGKN